jgi:hypothetical protein
MVGNNNENNPSFLSTFKELATSPTVLLSILGLAVVGALGYGIWSGGGTFLNSLQKTEIARGLITFLIAVATVGIAIILAIYVVVSVSPDLKERVAMGKDILNPLIGILGTIVGFYFGSATNNQATHDKAPESHSSERTDDNKSQVLQFAPLSIANDKPKKGDSISVSSFVYGGKKPYTYIISATPENIISPVSKTSIDGWIREEVKLADNIEKNTEIFLKVEVKDSDGKTSVFEDKNKKLTVTE